MKTGQVEGNLLTLNEEAKLTYIDELVERKLSGSENGRLQSTELTFYESEFERLIGELKTEADRSALPERPQSQDQLNDLLIRIRLA